MFHECRHIKTNGLRCHGAALRGKPYCYFHMNFRSIHNTNPAKTPNFEIPPIEDDASILLAVGQVIRTLNSPYADCRRAGLMLYALQIASKLTAREEQSEPSDLVRNLHNPSGDTVEFTEALNNGIDMLAPDKIVCEPPHDCRNCARQDSCENYEEPPEYEEEEYEEQQEDDEEYSEDEETADEEYDDEEDEESADEQDEEDESEDEEEDEDDDEEEQESDRDQATHPEAKQHGQRGLETLAFKRAQLQRPLKSVSKQPNSSAGS